MDFSLLNTFNRLALDVDLDPFTRKYCERRIKSEGHKFLTVTLPKLSKAVLRSLEIGHFDRSSLTDFAWKGKALRYFRSYLKRIFCLKTGAVLDEVDALAIYQLRQLCEYFYKLALPFDEGHLQEAENRFKSVDAELAEDYDNSFVDQLRKDFETYYSSIARAHIHEILDAYRPYAGPGTYADYKNAFAKAWYIRKDVDYTHPPHLDNLSGYSKPYPGAPSQGVNTSDPQFSEVLFVPKDSRGPRTIVREPFSILRYQMSFNAFLSNKLTLISRGRINFKSQLINRKLAEQSSRDRKMSTLDLKDASDRVSVTICRHIFRNSPGMRYFINHIRVGQTLLPCSRELLTLNKLAGMGSGLTFPTMSLIISLAASRAISDYLRCNYTKARSLVYVYGDDVIVPRTLYHVVISALERVKLKVNTEKSFSNSFFRESCGGDYYKGQDVVPVRLKLTNANLTVKGTTLLTKGSLAKIQLERHCRELVRNGLINLSEFYYSVLEKHLGRLPAVSGESPALGRYSILTPKYKVDEIGHYEPVKAIFPKSPTVREKRNPYILLGPVLLRSEAGALDNIFGSSFGQTDCEVTVPRKAILSRRRVSSYRLMG